MSHALQSIALDQIPVGPALVGHTAPRGAQRLDGVLLPHVLDDELLHVAV